MPERGRVDILFGLSYPNTRVQRTARALDAAGWNVRVLAWDREAQRPRHARDGRIRVDHSRVRSHSGRGTTQLIYLLRALRSHGPAMRADPPDVLHVVDLPVLAGALAIWPLGGGRRLVYDAFELYALMQAERYPRWLLRGVDLAERLLPRRADLVITPGAGRAAWFAERGIESVVVGNWIDAPERPPTHAAARRALGIPPERFMILYAGDLETSRDVQALIRHAERAPKDLVVIAGRGSQAAAVERAANVLPNVRWDGWLDSTAVHHAAADALYYALHPDHPYAAHPAPNNLYAAIAHGVPLIHRGQGEIGVLAREAEIGVAFDDDPSLDAAVDRLRDPSLRRHIRASLQSLQDRYNERATAATLVEAYERLVPRLQIRAEKNRP